MYSVHTVQYVCKSSIILSSSTILYCILSLSSPDKICHCPIIITRLPLVLSTVSSHGLLYQSCYTNNGSILSIDSMPLLQINRFAHLQSICVLCKLHSVTVFYHHHPSRRFVACVHKSSSAGLQTNVAAITLLNTFQHWLMIVLTGFNHLEWFAWCWHLGDITSPCCCNELRSPVVPYTSLSERQSIWRVIRDGLPLLSLPSIHSVTVDIISSSTLLYLGRLSFDLAHYSLSTITNRSWVINNKPFLVVGINKGKGSN